MKTPFPRIAPFLFILLSCAFSVQASPIIFDRTLNATVTGVTISFLNQPFEIDIPLGTPVTLQLSFAGEPVTNSDGSLSLFGFVSVPGNQLFVGLLMPIAFDAAENGGRFISDGTESAHSGVNLFPDGTFDFFGISLDGQPGFDTFNVSLTRSGELTFTSFDNNGLASIGITAQVAETGSSLMLLLLCLTAIGGIKFLQRRPA